MKVFLDSSFLIAYAIEKDFNHKKAVQLRIDGIFDNQCYVSNLIINEIVTVIGLKGNSDSAINIFNAIKDNCIIINEYGIDNFNEKVIYQYKKFNTKLSFTDCAIIEIMKEYDIKNLASFDKEFKRVKNINRIY